MRGGEPKTVDSCGVALAGAHASAMVVPSDETEWGGYRTEEWVWNWGMVRRGRLLRPVCFSEPRDFVAEGIDGLGKALQIGVDLGLDRRPIRFGCRFEVLHFEPSLLQFGFGCGDGGIPFFLRIR